MLRRLAFVGVRIGQLNRTISFQRMTFDEGTWVIPMNQEFAALVRELLDVQTYPDLREYPTGPPEQPYDAAGWTLPYLMDVRVVAASEPLSEEVHGAIRPLRGTAVDWRTADEQGGGTQFDSPPGIGFDTDATAAAIIPPTGRATGSGSRLVIDAAQNNAFRALNRAIAAGGNVRFLQGQPGDDGQPGSTGRYVIDGVSSSLLNRWVDELALQADRTGGSDGVPVRSRIGLYRPWRASIDEGWIRWLLEQYEFQFENITNAMVRSGNLRQRFDVIVLPAERSQTILDGFAKGGGTLVCQNQSSDFAIEQLHLPVKNAVRSSSEPTSSLADRSWE
ncbi:MAG: hypothetical protein P8X82_10245 [Gemmatimonadales bacterium]